MPPVMGAAAFLMAEMTNIPYSTIIIAAIVPAVAKKKVKRESAVDGRANVLVLPDLNCANTMIKTIQLFAGGKGYGHTLSGFRRPVADSSRGASVEEMVGDIAMLVLAAA